MLCPCYFFITYYNKEFSCDACVILTQSEQEKKRLFVRNLLLNIFVCLRRTRCADTPCTTALTVPLTPPPPHRDPSAGCSKQSGWIKIQDGVRGGIRVGSVCQTWRQCLPNSAASVEPSRQVKLWHRRALTFILTAVLHIITFQHGLYRSACSVASGTRRQCALACHVYSLNPQIHIACLLMTHRI